MPGINNSADRGVKRFKSHKGRVSPMLGKAVAKDPNTGVKESLVYKIKNPSHAIWVFIKENNAH